MDFSNWPAAESSAQAQFRAELLSWSPLSPRAARALSTLSAERQESKPPKDESEQLEEDHVGRRRWRKRPYRLTLHDRPPAPLTVKTGDTVSMYVVGGAGPHREGQPGFAVVNREGPDTSRIQLELTRDVTEMTNNWTSDEVFVGRRLVKLYRRQTGSRIELHFHELPAQLYDSTASVISCIWNQNIEDYVVTYADVVHALESLMMTTLAKEELVRVSRLMEHFEPDSHVASKALYPAARGRRDHSNSIEGQDDDDEDDDGQEDFYAVLRAYENPKPRKEEREIRFYEWSTLEAILHHLLSKYKVYTFDFRPTYPNDPHYNRAVLAQIPEDQLPPPISRWQRPKIDPVQPLRLHAGSFPVAPLPPSALLSHPPPQWPEGKPELPEPLEWTDPRRSGLKRIIGPRKNKNRKLGKEKDEKKKRGRPRRTSVDRHLPVFVPRCHPNKQRAVLFSEAHSPIRPPSWVPYTSASRLRRPYDPNAKHYAPRRPKAELAAIAAAKQARRDAREAKREAKRIRRKTREMKKLGLDIDGKKLVKKKRIYKSRAGKGMRRREPKLLPRYGTWEEVAKMRRAMMEALGLIPPGGK